MGRFPEGELFLFLGRLFTVGGIGRRFFGFDRCSLGMEPSMTIGFWVS
jgi:hypothetical protein